MAKDVDYVQGTSLVILENVMVMFTVVDGADSCASRSQKADWKEEKLCYSVVTVIAGRQGRLVI